MKKLPSVAILAGGLATRMHPLTEVIPKSLLVVAERPFIEWQIDYLVSQGVGRIIICAGHLGHLLRDHLGDGARFGVPIVFSYDGERLIGNGGALKRAVPLLGQSFFTLYGDSYLNTNLGDVYEAYLQAKKPALVTVFKNDGRWDKSNIYLTEDGTPVYSKGFTGVKKTHIDHGLGLISQQALDSFENREKFDLSDVYEELSSRGQLAASEQHHRFYEIGSPSGLKETERFLMKERKTR